MGGACLAGGWGWRGRWASVAGGARACRAMVGGLAWPAQRHDRRRPVHPSKRCLMRRTGAGALKFC
eukprot:2868710-Alexandrium_andersonii.AAC.1